MLIHRLFFWTLLYHLATFYKQSPKAFLLGLIQAPYFLVSRWMMPKDEHPGIVQLGMAGMKVYWQSEEAILPPAFVMKRLMVLDEETK